VANNYGIIKKIMEDKADIKLQHKDKNRRRKTLMSSSIMSGSMSQSRASSPGQAGGEVNKNWWSQLREEVHLNGNKNDAMDKIRDRKRAFTN